MLKYAVISNKAQNGQKVLMFRKMSKNYENILKYQALRKGSALHSVKISTHQILKMSS